jgi:DNA invertase Pin-like site-specific DNA recombinase
MKVACYCRVSTDEQTVENQKRDLLRYCENRGWKDIQVFEDTGISGSKHDRPALNDLMRQARQRRFSSILVWRFDRFARSTQHLLSALQEFQSLGIDFISYGEGIDTSTPIGKMIFTFISAISEFELSVIRSRVRSGIARAKAAGIVCGRPTKSFDMEKAVSLRDGGMSIRGIAKELSVGAATVYRSLSKNVSKTSKI